MTPVSPPSEPGGPGRTGRPTLEQVAAHAGVSRATVSRVVNRSASVDPHLVEVVSRAIRELDYVPNQAARALMTRRSSTVALVAAESEARFFGDPFFAGIVRGASQELSDAGMHLVISMARGADDLDRVGSFVRGGHVDGVLVISEHDSVDVLGQLRPSGVPLVVGGRPLSDAPDVAYVDHDNRAGGALAARRLLEVGRTRIGTVTGPQDMSAGVDRLAGFRDGLGRDFDPSLVAEGDFTTASGAEAVDALLGRHPDLDGLFVASDAMALGAISRLRDRGRRVPEDVAVVGFDDADVAAVASPPLTTIRQRTSIQGRLMAQLLLRRLGHPVARPLPEIAADPHARRVVLDVDLVVRSTA